MTKAGLHFWSGLNIALGALGFLMLMEGTFFWIGLGCAVAALVLGTVGKKSDIKSKRICSLVGILLAVLSAVFYALITIAGGREFTLVL